MLEKVIIGSLFDFRIRNVSINLLDAYMFEDDLHKSLLTYFKGLESDFVDDFTTLKLKVSSYYNIDNQDNHHKLETLYLDYLEYRSSDVKEMLNEIEKFLINKKLYHLIKENLRKNNNKLTIDDSMRSNLMESLDSKISVEKTVYNFNDERDLSYLGMDKLENLEVIKSKYNIINSAANFQGFLKGNLVCLAAKSGVGKAQPLSSKIKIPNGWTTMGKIKIGDKVDNAVGGIASVTGIFPQGIKDIYKITFEDGRSTECCKEHLWNVVSSHSIGSNQRINGTINLEKIYELNNKKSYRNRLYIQLYKPDLQEENIELPLHSYLLGALIGDGGFRADNIILSTSDEFIKEKINILSADYNCELIYNSGYDYRISQIRNIKKN